jgi:hypothetical protein
MSEPTTENTDEVIAPPPEEVASDNQASEVTIDPNYVVAGPSEEVVSLDIPTQPAPPEIITLDDVLADVDFIRKKELGDKILIESIGNLSATYIREKVKLWALSNFQDLFKMHEVTINLPLVCSDGVKRTIQEYVEFLTSMTIQQQLEKLRSRIQGFRIEVAFMGNNICLFLFKV